MKKERLITINTARLRGFLARFITFILRVSLLIILIGGAYLVGYYTVRSLSTIHVNSDLVIQYVNALKYPILILFFGILFQKPIRQFLSDADEISYRDMKASRSRKAQSSEPNNEINQIAPQAANLAEDTELAGDNQTEDEAIDEQLRSPEAIKEFNRIFSIIWGTQFRALQQLNIYRDGLSEDDFKDLLEDQKKLTNGNGFATVKDLMAYPVSEVLAKYNPETKVYNLTYAGLYFLNYITGKGLSDADLLY